MLTSFDDWVSHHSVDAEGGGPAIDQERFWLEQAILKNVWLFLGLTIDSPSVGGWFVTSIENRSAFVPRTGAGISGFENVCAHRRYPVRDKACANGPIICPFHHWRYDDEGQAVGIPGRRELFERAPIKLNASLRSIEVGICGAFVFGRFSGEANIGSLEHYPGHAFPILEAMSPRDARVRRMVESVEANWRLCFHITLDDCHAVAVHPTMLGKRGYFHQGAIACARIGLHGVFICGPDCNSLEKMMKVCREGSFRSSTYSIFHIFQNLLVVHLPVDTGHRRCSVQQDVPAARRRSTFCAWTHPAPFATPRPWFHRMTGRVTEPIRAHLFQHYVEHVVREDLRICENPQTVADRVVSLPRHCRPEERIDGLKTPIVVSVETLPGMIAHASFSPGRGATASPAHTCDSRHGGARVI